MTTPPREQGGFLGDACLSPATLPPTGPVRAGRFRERGSERLTACRMSRPPAPSGCAGCGVPGRRRFEHCTTGWCRGLLTFLYFIIGGRRFLWRFKRASPLAVNLWGKMKQRKEGRELTRRGFGGHLQSSAEHVEHVEAGLQGRLEFIAEAGQTVHQLAVLHLQGLDLRLRRV